MGVWLGREPGYQGKTMLSRPVRLLALLLCVAAATAAPAAAAPSVRHVFVIVLENENAATAFGSLTSTGPSAST